MDLKNPEFPGNSGAQIHHIPHGAGIRSELLPPEINLMGTGFYIRPTAPEEAAKYLRKIVL
jgi:hypothetical protein